jgi:hypothetical protein
MSLAYFPPDSGLFVPPTDHLNYRSSSPSQSHLAPPSHDVPSLSLNGAAIEYSRAPTADPSSPGAPGTPRGLKRRLSGGAEIYKKFKDHVPDFAVFGATMSGLPFIREAVNGIQSMQVST